MSVLWEGATDNVDNEPFGQVWCHQRAVRASEVSKPEELGRSSKEAEDVVEAGGILLCEVRTRSSRMRYRDGFAIPRASTNHTLTPELKTRPPGLQHSTAPCQLNRNA